MAETKLLELPYEKIAMSGGEMPKSLEYPDQILFLELRLLYDSYKRTEMARAAYRKDKTIENADKLLACVEGGKYYG